MGVNIGHERGNPITTQRDEHNGSNLPRVQALVDSEGAMHELFPQSLKTSAGEAKKLSQNMLLNSLCSGQFQQGFQQQPQFPQQQFVPQGGSFASSSASSSSGPIGLQGIVAFPVPVFVTRRPRCVTASGERGRCKPLSQCVTFYADVPELRRQPCPLNEVETGVCCPKKKRQQRKFT